MIKIEAKLSGAKNKQEATFNSPNYPPCLWIKSGGAEGEKNHFNLKITFGRIKCKKILMFI